MNINQIKQIMYQVNEPNEFVLEPFNLSHPYYWIYRVKNVRVKTLYKELERLRKPSARFDVFINGLFIREADYVFEMEVNDFHIKFIRSQFPEFDRFGNPYQLDETDEVKINGDLEKFK